MKASPSLLSHQRLFSTPTTFHPDRSPFEVDFDRIVFSQSFRNLQNKTQVVPLPEHEFVHTRLTHSLEVSCVGRSLGRSAGRVLLNARPEFAESGLCDRDLGAIVAAACLAHDLGNPPFGHAGEQAIASFYKEKNLNFLSDSEQEDLCNFEGNAQGFRLLTTRKDLSPTLATLGAFTKYPCASSFPGKSKKIKSQKKYGFFQSEAETFAEVANSLGLPGDAPAWKRHPLSFLVEAADDFCYLLIDVEDAVSMGRVSITEFEALMAPVLGQSLPSGISYQQRSRSEKAGLLRAMGIGKLVDACVETFTHHLDALLNGSFESGLADAGPYSVALSEISSFSVQRIYQAPEVLEIQAAGFELLPRLLEMVHDTVEELHAKGKEAAPKYRNLIQLLPNYSQMVNNETYYDRQRLLLDFISGLSDRHALSLFRKWSGIRF
jgi:dGTPase